MACSSRWNAALALVLGALGCSGGAPSTAAPRPPAPEQWSLSFVGEHAPTALIVEVAPAYFRVAGSSAALRIDYRSPASPEWRTDHVLVRADETFGLIVPPLPPPLPPRNEEPPGGGLDALLERPAVDWDHAHAAWIGGMHARLVPVWLDAASERGYRLGRAPLAIVPQDRQPTDRPVRFPDWTRPLTIATPPCNAGETPRQCLDRRANAFIRRFCDAVAARDDLARFRPYCAEMRKVLTGARRLAAFDGEGCNSPEAGTVGETENGTITLSGDRWLQHACPGEVLVHEFVHLVDHDARDQQIRRAVQDALAELQRKRAALAAAAPGPAAATAAAEAATAARAHARAVVDQAVHKTLIESEAYAATLGLREFIDGTPEDKARWHKSNMIGLLSQVKLNLAALQEIVDSVVDAPWTALEQLAQGKGATLGGSGLDADERARMRRRGCPCITHARTVHDALPRLDQLNVAELDRLKRDLGCP